MNVAFSCAACTVQIGDMTGKWKPADYVENFSAAVHELVNRKIKAGGSQAGMIGAALHIARLRFTYLGVPAHGNIFPCRISLSFADMICTDENAVGVDRASRRLAS